MRRIVPLFIGSLAACSEGPLPAPPVPQTVTDVIGLYTLSTVNDDSVAGGRILVGLRPCRDMPSADDSLFVGPEGSIDLRNDRTLVWNLVRQSFCAATSTSLVESRFIAGTYTTTDIRAARVTVRFSLSDTVISVSDATAIRGDDRRTGVDGSIFFAASTLTFAVSDSLGDYQLTFERRDNRFSTLSN